LTVGEFFDLFCVSGCVARVNESLFLHVDHEPFMSEEMLTKVILKHEQLLFERVLSLHSCLLFDGFLPHPHELPLFEFFEKVEFADVVEGISFNQPLS
jgi:hypothetical protein